jgi:hypothetical protein
LPPKLESLTEKPLFQVCSRVVGRLDIFSSKGKDMSDKMSVDKKDPPKEDSEESMESSPEGEEVPSAPPAQHAENQQPKRKGGRKPVR